MVPALVFLVGDVRELGPFLVALVVSLLRLQTCFGLQDIIHAAPGPRLPVVCARAGRGAKGWEEHTGTEERVDGMGSTV